MPRASPEAMTKPASPRSRASVPPNFRPAPEALREPTMAMTGRISTSAGPRTPSRGRRIVEHGEPRRIPRFARCNQTDAELFAGRQLSSRILLAANPSRARRAAAPRQVGQPLQRCPRAAEMIDQRTKRARPDIVTADQPQPVDALLVGQMRCTRGFDVHAAPAAAWINLREWGRGVEREACAVSQPS